MLVTAPTPMSVNSLSKTWKEIQLFRFLPSSLHVGKLKKILKSDTQGNYILFQID